MPQTAAWTVVGTAELPAVQKWHISRSHYSWPVVWRGPLSKGEEVYFIWSLYRKDEQNGWACWASPPQHHHGGVQKQGAACELSMVQAGARRVRASRLRDTGSLRTWPKITRAVIAAVTSSLPLGKHYLFLSPVSKNKHLTKFGLFLELRRVFEKLIYRLSPSCELRSFLIWPAEDTKSVLPKWHHGMICTSHLHMQCKFVIWANKYW